MVKTFFWNVKNKCFFQLKLPIWVVFRPHFNTWCCICTWNMMVGRKNKPRLGCKLTKNYRNCILWAEMFAFSCIYLSFMSLSRHTLCLLESRGKQSLISNMNMRWNKSKNIKIKMAFLPDDLHVVFYRLISCLFLFSINKCNNCRYFNICGWIRHLVWRENYCSLIPRTWMRLEHK